MVPSFVRLDAETSADLETFLTDVKKKSPSNIFLPALPAQIAQSAAFALGKPTLSPRLPLRPRSFPCPTGTS
jgi:hypothetical protein